MNTCSTDPSFIEFSFRLADHGGNRWVKSMEFKILATSSSSAIRAASGFVRDHSLVQAQHSVRWRKSRHEQNTFVFTGNPG